MSADRVLEDTGGFSPVADVSPPGSRCSRLLWTGLPGIEPARPQCLQGEPADALVASGVVQCVLLSAT